LNISYKKGEGKPLPAKVKEISRWAKNGHRSRW